MIQVAHSSLLSRRGLTYEAPLDIQERGGEATVEVLSLVHDMSDSQGELTKQSSFSFSRPVLHPLVAERKSQLPADASNTLTYSDI